MDMTALDFPHGRPSSFRLPGQGAGWGAAAWRGYDELMGMNARNRQIARANTLEAIRLVTDKVATKRVLAESGVPVAGTLDVIEDRRRVRSLAEAELPDEWVVKPNRGRGGGGILIALGRAGTGPNGWRRPSGAPLRSGEVRDHLRLLLDGEFSGGLRDVALVEPVLRAHPDLATLSYRGLPDVRVICAYDTPLLAMLRLPTRRSDGRANLHHGAVGAGLDLATGRIVAARAGRHEVRRHPDTGRLLLGGRVPFWGEVLRTAARCGPATGLRYVGADVVVTDAGPLILEVNARPGLRIQNVTEARALGRLKP